MRTSAQNIRRHPARSQAGMTLAEVMVAMVITGLTVGGIVTGYAYCTRSAEKAALSLAANARAMERIEETRSAKWDTASWPPVDQVVAANFPSKVVALDASASGQVTTSAKIETEISQISVTPPLKRIRVNCIWTFNGSELLVNTVETIRAPDQ